MLIIMYSQSRNFRRLIYRPICCFAFQATLLLKSLIIRNPNPFILVLKKTIVIMTRYEFKMGGTPVDIVYSTDPQKVEIADLYTKLNVLSDAQFTSLIIQKIEKVKFTIRS